MECRAGMARSAPPDRSLQLGCPRCERPRRAQSPPDGTRLDRAGHVTLLGSPPSPRSRDRSRTCETPVDHPPRRGPGGPPQDSDGRGSSRSLLKGSPVPSKVVIFRIWFGHQTVPGARGGGGGREGGASHRSVRVGWRSRPQLLLREPLRRWCAELRLPGLPGH